MTSISKGESRSFESCWCWCCAFWHKFRRRLKKDTSVTDIVRLRITANSRTRLGTDPSLLDFRDLLLAPDPTREISKTYEFSPDEVGAGAFGCVYKAKHKRNGKDFAIKQVPKTDVQADMDYVYAELEAMVKLDHPNVVKFYEFFEEPELLYIVTQLCEGGDFQLLNHGIDDPAEIRTIFKDMVKAVAYCHDYGVAHRDLKFENCLIHKDVGYRRVGKVIDFGLAAIRREGDTQAGWEVQLGTRYYIAPEIIDTRTKYGVQCDCWSMGVMLYIIMTDEHPCAANANRMSNERLFQKIMFATIRTDPLDAEGISDGHPARDFIMRLLVKKPDKRMTAAEALRHAYLEKRTNEPTDRGSWMSKTNAKGAKTTRKDQESGDMNDDMIQRIGTFGERTRFEKAILAVMAHQAHCTEVDELRASFVQLDVKGTGTLDKDEIREGLEKAGYEMTEAEINTLFSCLDMDGTGKVHYTEWLAATMRPAMVASDKAMRQVFDFMDIDGTGKVSGKELCELLGGCPQESKSVLAKADLTGDGCLSWEEFQEYMTGLVQRLEVRPDYLKKAERKPA